MWRFLHGKENIQTKFTGVSGEPFPMGDGGLGVSKPLFGDTATTEICEIQNSNATRNALNNSLKFSTFPCNLSSGCGGLTIS